jgi:hypothetical protein
MTKTFLTRFGKIRSASQRRYLLVGTYANAASPTGVTFIAKRSDKPETLHTVARREGYSWSLDHQCWVMKGVSTFSPWERRLVVLDTVTDQEVGRTTA